MDADALVVGAGAAGLMAARRLARKGLRVIVLEARDRIGGRVAERVISGSSERVEIGAEFIHGAAPQTMALLREAGIRSLPVGDTGWTFDEHGGMQPDDRDFGQTAALLAQASALKDDVSVDAYLEHFEREPATRSAAELARTFVEGFDAADPAIASVKGIAQEVGSGVDFNSTRPEGGYGPVFAALHESCVEAGVDVRLLMRVQKIAWQRGGVIVTCARETLSASAAIITLPVGVLRAGEVTFDPPLPDVKQHAMAGIEMGPVVKVCLAFTKAFWNGAFYRSASLPFGAYWTQYPKATTTLVAWAGGPRAAALVEKSADEVIEVAMQGLATMFGDAIRRDFIGAVWHNWSSDPFARGAYSYVRVGAMESREELAEPIDATLFFAGEACAAGGQGGTVHGAFATGERAADEVEGALC